MMLYLVVMVVMVYHLMFSVRAVFGSRSTVNSSTSHIVYVELERHSHCRVLRDVSAVG